MCEKRLVHPKKLIIRKEYRMSTNGPQVQRSDTVQNPWTCKVLRMLHVLTGCGKRPSSCLETLKCWCKTGVSKEIYYIVTDFKRVALTLSSRPSVTCMHTEHSTLPPVLARRSRVLVASRWLRASLCDSRFGYFLFLVFILVFVVFILFKRC